MIRLYQWLHRRASAIFSDPSRFSGQITSRRVVTVESEERILLVRSRAAVWPSDEPSPGDPGNSEQTIRANTEAPHSYLPGLLDGQEDHRPQRKK